MTVMKAEQYYQQNNIPEIRKATYEWTMAESYMTKAREEYAESSYEDAEKLAEESIKWIDKAKETAENPDTQNTEKMDGAQQ